MSDVLEKEIDEEGMGESKAEGIEKRKTCLHRFLGKCPDCREDYNLNHHPNNLDCPGYKEIVVRYFNVK